MAEREMVEAFHKAMGLPVREQAEMPNEAARQLRCHLLLEETLEFIRASGFSVVVNDAVVSTNSARIFPDYEPNLAAMAHENADVRVITLSTDLYGGFPPEVFAEVMRANMSKLGTDGHPVVRKDGKVLKGPNYRPPDIAGVLRQAEHPGMCIGGAYCTCPTRG